MMIGDVNVADAVEVVCGCCLDAECECQMGGTIVYFELNVIGTLYYTIQYSYMNICPFTRTSAKYHNKCGEKKESNVEEMYFS